MPVVCSLTWVAAACDDPAAPGQANLPASYRVTAEAQGTTNDLDIACALDLLYEVTEGPFVEGTARVYHVRGGGEASRSLFRADGSGLVVQPTLFSPSDSVRLLPRDSIELITPINLETGVAFYENIGFLAGHRTADGGAEGSWTCGPFEIEQDSTGSVQGTWALEATG